MPAYTFYYPGSLQQGGSVNLSSEEAHHATSVMRVRQGQQVQLINGKGQLALARVINTHKGCELDIEKILKSEPLPSSTLTIVQGLTAMNKADWIIEKLTELGAEQICFFAADKSPRQQLSDNQLQKLTAKSINAAKQSGQLHLPKITWLDSLQLLKPLGHLITMSIDGVPIETCELAHGPITAVIGPESGLSHAEAQWLGDLGALSINLHPNILRSETASVVACSSLKQLMRRSNH